MTCDRAIELLPWLLNGTLAESEAAELRAHLAGCEGCRRELRATHRAGRAFGAHPEAESLVVYALGRPVPGTDRSALESHLADCESCREELELIAEAEGAAPATAAPARASAEWGGWRSLALAASLATVVAGGGLVLQIARTGPAEPNVAVVELLPESRRARGPDEAAVALAGGRSVALVLLTDLAEPFDVYRVRVIAGDGATRWLVSGLEPTADGNFTLLLPAADLPAGEIHLELAGRRAGAWTPLESYVLRR